MYRFTKGGRRTWQPSRLWWRGGGEHMITSTLTMLLVVLMSDIVWHTSFRLARVVLYFIHVLFTFSSSRTISFSFACTIQWWAVHKRHRIAVGQQVAEDFAPEINLAYFTHFLIGFKIFSNMVTSFWDRCNIHTLFHLCTSVYISQQ